MANNNQYELQSKRCEFSQSIPINIADIDLKIKETFKDTFAKIVCWLDYAVMFGDLTGDKVNFLEAPDYIFLERMRIFNDHKELLIWRAWNGLQYRVLDEAKGNDETEFFKAEQILWGTDSDDKGVENTTYKRVFESRGTELIIPAFWITKELKPEQRLKLITHNYIKPNETGQYGIFDCRFVDIKI